MKKRVKKKDDHVSEEVDIMEEETPLQDEPPADADDEDAPPHDDIPYAEISDAEEDAPGTGESALGAVERERDDLKDQLLRARAEFDNYRKRMARESDQQRKTAAQGLMRSLLPIVDNLERALGHANDANDGFVKGVEMIVKQFADVLAAQGLEVIPAVGEAFDPNIHEALTHMPSDQYPVDTVMEEFQRGYRIGDFVLRPSQVVVSSGAPQAPVAEEPDGGGVASESEAAE